MNAGPLWCEDWRTVEAPTIARLYETECGRWRENLAWDFSPSCRIVEAARRAGQLPGFVVRSGSGAVAGWSFHILHERRLQIGGIVGESEAARGALLRATLDSREAHQASAATCFLHPQSQELAHTLRQERFEVEPHAYLVRDLPAPGAEAPTAWPAELAAGPFEDGDPAGMADMLARAYEGRREAACFAPDLRPEQWAHYLERLLQTEACGRYLPGASFALRDVDERPVAASLMTRISEDTAHLAQLVVDPRWRGRSLGSALLAESCRTLAARGYRRVTLIVAGDNTTANRLYRGLGFVEQQLFLYGVRAGRPASGG